MTEIKIKEVLRINSRYSPRCLAGVLVPTSQVFSFWRALLFNAWVDFYAATPWPDRRILLFRKLNQDNFLYKLTKGIMMSKYVDGFVIPVKKSKLKAYKKMATIGRQVWMKYGALDYYECVGAKLDQEWGIPFSKLCKLKTNETVIFAFVVYKSKAHRDQVTAEVHKDPLMQPENFKGKMPFDMKRFTSGEFKAIVHS